MKAITQGKWREGGASQEGLGAIRICAGGFIIADVFFKREWQHAPERDEAEANAKLIAAAPELLAACQSALNVFQGWVKDCDPSLERGESAELDAARDMVALMRIAIFKATL